jgi:phage shock protein A
MWSERAELAVKAGDDNLAREALKRKKAAEQQLEPWAAQMRQQDAAISQLRANTSALESRMAGAETKKDSLKARAASAKSSKQVHRLKRPRHLIWRTGCCCKPVLLTLLSTAHSICCLGSFNYFPAFGVQIQDLLAGLDTSSSFAAFDQMEQKV